MTHRLVVCHYRVGMTDGVSLEIDKRRDVLRGMGWEVAYLAGPGSQGADFVVDELDFDSERVRRITHNAFSSIDDYASPGEMLADIEELAATIAAKVSSVLDEVDPDTLFLHNIFSHGRHIPSAKAFYDVVVNRHIPCVATHHDFYFEREEFSRPTCKEIRAYLDQYVPPRSELISHVTINSLMRDRMAEQRGLSALLVPDTFDFKQEPWQPDEYNHAFLSSLDIDEGDIIALQATRIVPRKGIELAVNLLAALNENGHLGSVRGQRLYNGKEVSPTGRFVLVLAGYAEKEARPYRERLSRLLEERKVPHYFIDHAVRARRCMEGAEKRFSLWDAYAHCDFVTYPSIYEGWGNQFMEAVFARRPIVIFEYPVFKTDIGPCGYHVVSLGDNARYDTGKKLYCVSPEVVTRAADKLVQQLLSPDTVELLQENFHIAQDRNSYDVLERLLARSMEHRGH